VRFKKHPKEASRWDSRARLAVRRAQDKMERESIFQSREQDI
jgi:hypothetical protein